MASSAPFLFLVISFCCCSAQSFVNVVCDKTIIGQVGHQSMLTCKVETTQEIPNLKIYVIVWKKKGDDQFLSVLDKRPGKKNKSQPGYEIVLNNRTVSLVIKDTEVKDEGIYTCQVITDSGIPETPTTTDLQVTAKYHPPTINSSDEKDIPNAHKTLICKATGGYPKGELRWFDENKTEWTKSAKLTVNKTENGLLELYSKLPLMKASTFSEYTCMVYNASGHKMDSVAYALKSTDPDTPKPLSTIIAPVLVVGSLIVGLLMALLFFRRRSQQKNRRPSTAPLMGTHDMVPHSHEEIDPPPPYSEEIKDSFA